MLNQVTLWDRLEDFFREGTGMLRRRIPAVTVAAVVTAGAAFGVLGADALATGNATALASAGGLVALALAARRWLR